MANPERAWLGLLLLIPLILHLSRRRETACEVSSLVFFKRLAREFRDRVWWRRMRRWLALFLSLALPGGVILALLRLTPGDREGELRSVVVVLDRSASMGALLPDARTRLEAAKEGLLARLDRLGPRVSVSLIAFDQRAEVVLLAERDPYAVRRQVDRWEPRLAEGNEAAAIDLAEALAKQAAPAEVWWVSDRPEAALSRRKGAADLRWIAIRAPGGERLNLGLTAFQLRPLPLQRSRLACFLEVVGNGAAGEGVNARLEVRIGTAPAEARPLTVGGGEPQVIEFPVAGRPGQELHLRLNAAGDCLAADNEILVRLPEAKPVVALRVGERERIDPFAHVALQSLVEEGELEVWSAEPAQWQWPVRGPDVVLFDHWLPPEWPDGVAVIVMDPPGDCGPVRVARLREGPVAQSRIAAADEVHPVLFRVSSGRLSVAQTCTMELAAGIEPLWRAGRETLLAAGQWKGQRVVVMGFSPRQSGHLPLTDAFPLLMGNAISWCAGATGDDRALRRQSLRAGGVLAVAGKEVAWWSEDGGRQVSETRPVPGGCLALDRPGIWRTDEGETGAVHLLSLQETREAGAVPADSGAGEAPSPARIDGWRPPRDLTGISLGAVLVLLLAESLLCHRFGVN